MNDKKIITKKELNYIETLYLYCNIEDFVSDSSDNHPTLNYRNMMGYIEATMLHSAKYLNEAKGRSWYKFPNYRIGIMPYDTAKKANQFNCVIQYEQHHMFTLNKNLDGLDLPFDGTFSQYHIKRIDITKIAKHDEDYTTNYGYLSPYKRKDNVNGTIYLGNRKNGNVFRMYNKTRELLDTENYKKIELLSKYFGDIENLYTYELELSRSFLKNDLGIETLADLPKVYQVYKNIVGKIRFYKDTDRNKKLLIQNKRERIKALVLTDFEEYERMEKKRYDPSRKYAIDQVTKIIDSYLTSVDELESLDYLNFYIEAMKRRVDYNQKDLVISFEDTVLSDETAQMTAKHKEMRCHQDNTLELEANRAFKKIENNIV